MADWRAGCAFSEWGQQPQLESLKPGGSAGPGLPNSPTVQEKV